MSSLTKHVAATVLVLGFATTAAGAAFVWSGAYDIGADARHTRLVYSVLDTLRERSVKVRAGHLQVPDLTDKLAVAQGAGNYHAMCVPCHMAPGIDHTELSRGLYPQPPNLTQQKTNAAHAFWVVKHGIKASAMPAWGHSMPDADIWNVAAFLQKLPELDSSAYEQMVAASGGHSHGGGESAAPHDVGSSAQDRPSDTAGAAAAHNASGADGHHAHKAEITRAAASAAAPPSASTGPERKAAPGHYDDGHKH